MISCVDTSIILDVIMDDPVFGDVSYDALRRASQAGSLAICDLVYSELAPQFESKQELDETLNTLGIRVIESGRDVAYLAGTKWGDYRVSGGTRQRMLPDFMIGAHALLVGECLLTRDRGFYRSYFPNLELLPG
jgi:predicted nucleic acid-binding protein